MSGASGGRGGASAGGAGLAGIGGITTAGSGGSAGLGGASGASGTAGGGGTSGGAGGGGGTALGGSAGTAGGGNAPCGGSCPTNYSCGTANGLQVCRASNGVPLFTSVFVIVMENTSLGTLQSAMSGTGAPNLATMKSKYATGAAYHGVAHPSVPNYLALTSGDTQGAMCDCAAAPGVGSCGTFTCSLVFDSCSCDVAVTNIADQLEAAQMSWQAFGEGMGTACNLTDAESYTAKHMPFLYYDDIRNSSLRCNSHVLDLSALDLGNASRFNFIAPDIVHDMQSPTPTGAQNIPNGDGWIGPEVTAITGSAAYKQGGLLVVVWDEDDGSGGVSGSDDPIPIFVLSPFAKSGGYVSPVKADHYSLLATLEDGLALPRLGNAGTSRAGMADTLADYFPSN